MKYHSTVSKGTFMRMLGLGGTRAEAAPSGFHDLDEVTASPTAQWRRPWWVRVVDKPTVDVDWDGMERFDGRKMQQVYWRKYVGEDEAKRLGKLREEKTKQWIMENKPGYTLRRPGPGYCWQPGRLSWRQLPGLLG